MWKKTSGIQLMDENVVHGMICRDCQKASVVLLDVAEPMHEWLPAATTSISQNMAAKASCPVLTTFDSMHGFHIIVQARQITFAVVVSCGYVSSSDGGSACTCTMQDDAPVHCAFAGTQQPK